MSNLKELFKKLEIDKPVTALIEQSFYHSSYFYENIELSGSNERLEFVGDAVLELWTSTRLYQNINLDEGKMTVARSQFVRENSFCQLAKQLNLDQYLCLGVGEEKTGGRTKSSILADLFEAFIGAIYLSYDIEYCFSFLDKHFALELMNYNLDKGPKTRLQEYVQADKRNNLQYEVSGDNNNFRAIVYLNKIVLGSGSGKSKKEAEQNAAKSALEKVATND
ncbi:MAG: ribonuclease III [Erysipelotrichaceae bacterium]